MDRTPSGALPPVTRQQLEPCRAEAVQHCTDTLVVLACLSRSIRDKLSCHSVSDEHSDVKTQKYGAADETQRQCVLFFLPEPFALPRPRLVFSKSLGGSSVTPSLHHPSLRSRTATMIAGSISPHTEGRQGAHSNARSQPATTE